MKDYRITFTALEESGYSVTIPAKSPKEALKKFQNPEYDRGDYNEEYFNGTESESEIQCDGYWQKDGHFKELDESVKLPNEPEIMSDDEALTILQKRYDKLVEEFEQYKRESIKWSTEDFIMRAQDIGEYLITEDQAQLALNDMIRSHDAEWGIGWHSIDYFTEKYGIKISDL